MTPALDELDPEDLPDVDDLDDPDDEPTRAPRRVSRHKQARAAIRHDRSDTRDALCELVRDALGVKIGHDLDRFDVALDHLDTIASNLDDLRTAIAAEHATTTHQDNQP